MASFSRAFRFPLRGNPPSPPSVGVTSPADGAAGILPDSPVVIDFIDGLGVGSVIDPTTISITVNGVLAWLGAVSLHGWVGHFVHLGAGGKYTVSLWPPDGFTYGATVSVTAAFDYA